MKHTPLHPKTRQHLITIARALRVGTFVMATIVATLLMMANV
jgi:hypothetical protein